MAQTYISLGTNSGKRLQNIQLAVKKLKDIILIEKISSPYLTQPVEIKGGWFINCVIRGQTEKEPLQLLKCLLQIEKEMGRVRGKKEKRTIDLDILFFEEKIIKMENLTIPHPRAHQRRFVLVPLAEINPQLKHPLFGKSIQVILNDLQDISKVEKVETTIAN